MHAIALRCQLRIEPQRRPYDPAEQEGLGRPVRHRPTATAPRSSPFSGPTPPRWCRASRALATSTCRSPAPTTSTSAPPNTSTRSRGGDIPLVLLFSGTVFTRGESGFAVEQLSWSLEASYRLPVSRLAPADGPLLPRQRLDPARPRHHRRPRPLPHRPRADLLGRRSPVVAGFPHPRRCRRHDHRTGRADRAHQVADAVLYEGYLLYPYRASSAKNQVRWQFGVLGPTGAAEAGVGRAHVHGSRACCSRPSDRAPHRHLPALPAGAGSDRRALDRPGLGAGRRAARSAAPAGSRSTKRFPARWRFHGRAG